MSNLNVLNINQFHDNTKFLKSLVSKSSIFKRGQESQNNSINNKNKN